MYVRMCLVLRRCVTWSCACYILRMIGIILKLVSNVFIYGFCCNRPIRNARVMYDRASGAHSVTTIQEGGDYKHEQFTLLLV